MKIGILTHPLMYNYGGILQNYALQRVLKDMGHDVLTVNRRPDFNYKISVYSVLNYLHRMFNNIPKRKLTRWNPNLSISRAEYCLVSSKINKFIEDNIVRTEDCFDRDLSAIDEKYRFDCYVVGSDQVWVPGCCPLMFINFTNRADVKKLFYAASAGSTSWMDVPEKKEQCISLSKNFSAISVREESLRTIAEETLKRQVSVNLDPTMLLEPKRYFKNTILPTKSTETIFSYILDSSPQKTEMVSTVSKMLGMPVITGFTIDSNKRVNVTLPGVEEWLQELCSANYVITDSFHGCVFSILFKKQFSVIINESRGGNRFLTLLSRFNLLNRKIKDINDLINNVSEVINYDEIELLLNDERTKSIQYLINSLQS